jgi:ubiquinone/menaquinone biosynthesis C-methylase UbiE
MDNFMCKICGEKSIVNSYKVREMYFGTKDEFLYHECGGCGCLQILDPPENIALYYPDYYYSKKNRNRQKTYKIFDYFRKKQLLAYLQESSTIGFALNKAWRSPHLPKWMTLTPLKSHYKILDVGSGTGKTLLKLRRNGFMHLKGIDLYINTSIDYKNGVTISKCNIEEVDGKFDYIILNHSLEHLPDQKVTFEHLYRLLKKNRYVMIRIPTVSSYAWRHYRENWIQLDAPRHFFLHSVQSLEHVTRSKGFDLVDVVYDSTEFQFVGSEMYLKGLSLSPNTADNTPNKHLSYFSENDIHSFRVMARDLNRKNDGDQACFILYKK